MKRLSAIIKVLLVCLPFFFFLGCAAQNTNWTPVVDSYNDPNADRISADLYECRQLAVQASGDTAREAGKGGLVGGALGAATGAALGAVSGNAGRGAAYGVAAGGFGGAAHQGLSSNEQYKSAYRKCMRGRGHSVLN